MQLSSPTHSEIRLTLEVIVDIVNRIAGTNAEPLARGELRSVLTEKGFSRAQDASEASFKRLNRRLRDLAPLLHALPSIEGGEAARRVNEQLTELTIAPSIVDHDGVGPHIHWTPPTARFDDQVMADALMALIQELCDDGTSRFGQCGAENCNDVFYDGTRNRSKRFCADPKCSSRTHTAEHRARKRTSRS